MSHRLAGMLPWLCGCSSQSVTVCPQALPSQLSHAQRVQEAASQKTAAWLLFAGLAQSIEAYIGVPVLQEMISGWPTMYNNHSGD